MSQKIFLDAAELQVASFPTAEASPADNEIQPIGDTVYPMCIVYVTDCVPCA